MDALIKQIRRKYMRRHLLLMIITWPPGYLYSNNTTNINDTEGYRFDWLPFAESSLTIFSCLMFVYSCFLWRLSVVEMREKNKAIRESED